MNRTQQANSANNATNAGKPDFRHTRTVDDPLGIDDTGLPADTRPDDARAPHKIDPDPVGPADTAAHQDAAGRVPLEENQRHPSDPLKPGEEDEYGTRLEKLVSKVEPPGREVSDEDILDPGRMTPGAPPVDNRS